MIFGFSPHTGHTISSEILRAIIYFLQEMARKNLAGKRVTIRRDPAPELLLGNPDLMLTVVRSLRTQHRYTAMTLSFLQEDISAPAFNGGDRVLRDQIGRSLRLLQECAYPGIPHQARFAPLVGTHTHTGRLEINVLMPRAVLAANGKILSHNPHPPREGSQRLWEAFRDVLNSRFGWADPMAFERRRKIILPDFVLKQAAENRRNGISARQLQSTEFAAIAEGFVEDGIADKRSLLLAHMAADGYPNELFPVTSASRNGVTIRDPGIGGYVKVGGYLMSQAFENGVPFLGMSRPEYQTRREAEIARAPRDLHERMQGCAIRNAERYGYPLAPVPNSEAVLAMPGLPLPPCHPDFIYGGTHGQDRKSHGAPSHRAPAAARTGTGVQDRGAGGGDGGTEEVENGSHAGAQLPQPDFDARALLTGLKTHLQRVLTRLRERQLVALMLDALDQTGLERFTRIATDMEKWNETRRHAAAGAVGRIARAPANAGRTGRPASGNDGAAGQAEAGRSPERVFGRSERTGRSTAAGERNAHGGTGEQRDHQTNGGEDRQSASQYGKNRPRRAVSPEGLGAADRQLTGAPSRAELISKVLAVAKDAGTTPKISFERHDGREWLRADTNGRHFLYDGRVVLDFDPDGNFVGTHGGLAPEERDRHDGPDF
ncbi:hypothetical protein [Martelella mediterranea]|uniref:hypothetical protein n=1 Tax=Martelella mediterranea TaxID=293089 RepID=UPI0012BB0798|nr:hypothetical protein [Martelella mediterranea]